MLQVVRHFLKLETASSMMSLFLASLAFETSGVNMLFDERLGIIAGSLISGLGGYLVLRATLPATAATNE